MAKTVSINVILKYIVQVDKSTAVDNVMDLEAEREGGGTYPSRTHPQGPLPNRKPDLVPLYFCALSKAPPLSTQGLWMSFFM